MNAAEKALKENLRKVVPRGSIIHVYFPKDIIARVLPSVASEKKCIIVCFGGSREAQRKLAPFLARKSKNDEADLIITEPVIFTKEGGLFHPDEAFSLQDRTVVGVGMSHFTKINPAHLDFVAFQKTVTNLGVLDPVHLEHEINAS